MEKFKYLVVEGIIGVGKTSLAEMLTKRLNAKRVLEVVEENPFLADFYKDMDAYAFQTQIFFLLSRHKQQIELKQMELFSTNLLSDYMRTACYACNDFTNIYSFNFSQFSLMKIKRKENCMKNLE